MGAGHEGTSQADMEGSRRKVVFTLQLQFNIWKKIPEGIPWEELWSHPCGGGRQALE